jgi:hypothetical protein
MSKTSIFLSWLPKNGQKFDPGLNDNDKRSANFLIHVAATEQEKVVFTKTTGKKKRITTEGEVNALRLHMKARFTTRS